MKKVLAFDFGASSGRAMLAYALGGDIVMEEIHRFTNDPVEVNGIVYWDILRLYHEIKQGIIAAKAKGGFDSIGIDTWGVDFGLIDVEGNMIDAPVHYRDHRTDNIMEEVANLIPQSELYSKNGIQALQFNTIYQLYYLSKYKPEYLKKADKLLFMPDLMAYLLTGAKRAEHTICSTSGLLSLDASDWNYELSDRLGIPSNLFAPLIKSGEQYGMLQKSLAEELGIPSVPVYAVCTHDTASAVAAVPQVTNNNMYISSGTWSLMGLLSSKTNCSEDARLMGFTNERGYKDSVIFLKNIMGLWLIQECRRQWRREGMELSFADIESEATSVEPFRSFIDTDDSSFIPMGNMPERIREYCKRTSQIVPVTVGEVARVIYDSLAMKYRNTKKDMEKLLSVSIDSINIVGGGSKDSFLNQFTASATGVVVTAGPIEGTVIGNIIVQLVALGEFMDYKEAQKAIIKSFALETFKPADTEIWDAAYNIYKRVINNG